MNTYVIGRRIKLVITISGEDGNAADPTTLVFQMREPSGTLTSYTYGTDDELVRSGVGAYYVYWDAAMAGFHTWRGAASGNVGVAEESSFAVLPSLLVVS